MHLLVPSILSWAWKPATDKIMIRIGTRDSRLAMAQATMVEKILSEHQVPTEIHSCKSEGDKVLNVPLYEMGIQGIFTRELDTALLRDEIDIAVHSLKDVPTRLAQGLVLAAVLPRASHFDMLICRDEESRNKIISGRAHLLGTSSIRRRAQWAYRYPQAEFEVLRGNVPTRIRKMSEQGMDAIILAEAGLQRLGLTESETGPWLRLDWMVPAPSQGIIGIVCRDNDKQTLEKAAYLHDEASFRAALVEREFLRLMQGGCSLPISAIAVVDNKMATLRANVTAPNGTASLENSWSLPVGEMDKLAAMASDWMQKEGAARLLTT